MKRAVDATMPSMDRPGIVRLVALLLVAVVASTAAATVVSAGSTPRCRIGDVLTEHRTSSDWDRSLLDTKFRLGRNYAPADLRSTRKAGLNGGHKVRSFVLADLRAMAKAARAAGARFAVQSAYRSYATQRATFSHWVTVYGYRRALQLSARAGHSEHQLGTTVDLRKYGGAAPWDVPGWGKTTVGRWLRKNAWKFGFIRSYPKGKIGVTCYANEPWHYRYVGRDRAAAVRASDLTLREFLWDEQTTPEPTPTPTPSPTPTPTPTPTPEPPPPA